MKVMSVLGTRPEMIKMWSVLKKLDKGPFDHIFVHTSQNFTKELKDFFFNDLELRKPDYDLNIDVTSYGAEVADVIRKSDSLIKKVKPDALIVLGDTYSGLCVLPASNANVKVFHMEAGLRAYDRRMPEQRNRILIDHISDILLPFNSYHRENLIRENIHPSKIIVSGNPTFEVLSAFMPKIDHSNILDRLNLKPNEYFSVTVHRKENTENLATLQEIFQGLQKIAQRYGKQVIYPMHPRTKSKLAEIQVPKELRIIDPLGFYDFNKLSKNAFCLLGDSGTTPEEALLYRKPCVSIRQTTERFETLEAGGHIVAGTKGDQIEFAVQIALSQENLTRYDLNEDFSSSNVVINAISSNITNYF